MKKLFYILPLLFCFSLGFAQEKLTKEEQARREKNIQAGNPFARFGYKAKVATLSQGKYLEFHDNDTIVIIGSKYYNTLKQEIVCDIKIDSTNADRQPIGDTAGRWISPDPLSEEFPDWSPYNFCMNNPMRYVDPDGMAPYDHIFSATGQFIKDTKVGNAVKVEIGGKLYSPSQLDTSRGSRFAMINIAAHYAGKVGADVGTVITSSKGTTDSNENPAWTSSTKVISLNTNGGFSKALDDINDFKSVMGHENNHKEDYENPKFKSDLSNHADVYLNQMQAPSFSNTTPEFKSGMVGSFANYLLNMNNTQYGSGVIDSKIATFNSLNIGYQISPTAPNYYEGTLKLNITNTTTGAVSTPTYQKIADEK